MNIEGADKLGHLYLLPYTKIYTMTILPDHPAEVHVDALAGRLPCWCGYVLPCPFGVLYREEVIVEMNKGAFYCFVCVLSGGECLL